MTSITQLFKIITCNDYDSLEKIIMCNEKLDFNCTKSGQSLISKAIEVRALECFNLLIELNDLTILQSTCSNISGLYIAIDYYSSAPNNLNRYYLEKLLEKNVAIDANSLILCMNDPILFEKMFVRIDKNFKNLSFIIQNSIYKLNIQIMNILYDYIQNKNLPFYNTNENKKKFNDMILKSAIDFNNIIAIDFLESIGHNISSVDYNQIINFPSLYYSIKKSNTKSISFDYFYKKLEELNPKELNQIPHIKNLSLVFINHQYEKEFKKVLSKLLKLPIDWDDISDVIANLYWRTYDDNRYSHYIGRGKTLQQIKIRHQIMYMLLKTNNVKANPYDRLITHKNEINNIINSNYKKFAVSNNTINNIIVLSEFKSALRKNKYLLNEFGFTEPTSFSDHYKILFTDHYKILFTDENSTYETEKNTFMEEMKNLYKLNYENNKTNKKKAPKEINV
jgi:hypothetical protein